MQPLRRSSRQDIATTPQYGQRTVGLRTEVDLLDNDGAISTFQVREHVALDCGCFGKPALQCQTCGAITCTNHAFRCASCLRALCPRHAYPMHGTHEGLMMCRRCRDEVLRRQRVRSVLGAIAGVFRGRQGGR